MRISAAILAGGRASRLGGRDKTALVVEGRTILERQLTEIARVTEDIVIVGRAAATGAPPLLPAKVRIVADIVPGQGPLGGLHTALEETTGDVLLLLAGDMPYVTAPFLAYLASLANVAAVPPVSPGGDAVVPRTERGYHPLCAAYTRACRRAVTARLADGRLAMKDLLTDLRLRVVMAEEIESFGNHDRLLTNINTPADLNRITALT